MACFCQEQWCCLELSLVRNVQLDWGFEASSIKSLHVNLVIVHYRGININLQSTATAMEDLVNIWGP